MIASRPRRVVAAACALAALAVAALLASPSAADGTPPGEAPARPQLVLLIVVDQMRADYLERFDPFFGDGGFRRLEKGCVYRGARYAHATTSTGPGHATIMTGGYADRHGIPGNDWIERATLERIPCCKDPAERFLTPSGPAGKRGGSPRCLRTSTFADELAAARPGTRVVAISKKDYAACLLSGRAGKAYYWEPAAGGFTTSTYYAPSLPTWVAAWDGARSFNAYRREGWRRFLPEEAYAIQGADDQPWEQDGRLGRVFPHSLEPLVADLPTYSGTEEQEYLTTLVDTPFINSVTADFATTALRAEALGKRAGATDVLCVSFSGIDYVGHRFGMESHEMLDAIARIDRDIARLLEAVDREVGLARTLVVLTADHGMAPTPEAAAARGFPAGRLDPAEIERVATLALQEMHSTRPWVAQFVNPGVYFWPAALSGDPPEEIARWDRAPERETAQRLVAAAVLQMPGVAQTFTRNDLLRGTVPPTDVGRAVSLAYDPHRSGDVVIVARPFWLMDEGPFDECAAHGSPSGGEQHVPLLLLGAGVPPGRHDRQVSPADIAPTIARILGLSRPSGAEGEVLVEALPK